MTANELIEMLRQLPEKERDWPVVFTDTEFGFIEPDKVVPDGRTHYSYTNSKGEQTGPMVWLA